MTLQSEDIDVWNFSDFPAGVFPKDFYGVTAYTSELSLPFRVVLPMAYLVAGGRFLARVPFLISPTPLLDRQSNPIRILCLCPGVQN